MIYEWKHLGTGIAALFEQGDAEIGVLPYLGPAIIHRKGPFEVQSPQVAYQVSGTLFEPAQDFGSLDQALNAAESAIDMAGDAVEGPKPTEL